MAPRTSSTTGTFYFAYGSNLSPAQLSERCPENPATSCVPVAIARLDGWKWIICQRGYANVVPSPSPNSRRAHGRQSSEPKEDTSRPTSQSRSVSRPRGEPVPLQQGLERESHSRSRETSIQRPSPSPAISIPPRRNSASKSQNKISSNPTPPRRNSGSMPPRASSKSRSTSMLRHSSVERELHLRMDSPKPKVKPKATIKLLPKSGDTPVDIGGSQQGSDRELSTGPKLGGETHDVVYGLIYNLSTTSEAILDLYEGHNEERNARPAFNVNPYTNKTKPHLQGGWCYNKFYLPVTIVHWLRSSDQYLPSPCSTARAGAEPDLTTRPGQCEQNSHPHSINTSDPNPPRRAQTFPNQPSSLPLTGPSYSPSTIVTMVYVDELRTRPGPPKGEYVGRMQRAIDQSLDLGMPIRWVEKVMRPAIPVRGAPRGRNVGIGRIDGGGYRREDEEGEWSGREDRRRGRRR